MIHSKERSPSLRQDTSHHPKQWEAAFVSNNPSCFPTETSLEKPLPPFSHWYNVGGKPIDMRLMSFLIASIVMSMSLSGRQRAKEALKGQWAVASGGREQAKPGRSVGSRGKQGREVVSSLQIRGHSTLAETKVLLWRPPACQPSPRGGQGSLLDCSSLGLARVGHGASRYLLKPHAGKSCWAHKTWLACRKLEELLSLWGQR